MFKKLLDYFKGKSADKEPQSESAAPKRRRKTKKSDGQLSEKERATAAGEPYVSILRVELDPQNINSGSFELDWNDKFIINLMKAGYKVKDDDTDQIIVDRWFQTVCRNIALEIYEQYRADPKNRVSDDVRHVSVRKLDDGRSEIS